MSSITITSLSKINEAASMFLDAVKGYKVIAFYGEMGAGKTTFINAVCRQLGVVSDWTNSPSFSIINEYQTERGEVIYHFDLYRLDSVEDALDIGVEDYFDSGNLCLLEWPERIQPLLPDDTLRVDIAVDDNDIRVLTF